MYNFTQRSPITIILLSIITCGIYFIYWLYVTSKEINDALGREEINTALVILGFFCFPVMIYVMYKLGNAIDELAGRRFIQTQSSFILWLILCLLFGVGIYIMEYQVQSDLNNFSFPNNYTGGPHYNNYGSGYNQQNYNQSQSYSQTQNEQNYGANWQNQSSYTSNQSDFYQPPANGQNYIYNQQSGQQYNNEQSSQSQYIQDQNGAGDIQGNGQNSFKQNKNNGENDIDNGKNNN